MTYVVMNPILLRSSKLGYSKIYEYIDYGFNAIDTGDEDMPIQFYPDEMPHGQPCDAWDLYENQLFDEHYQVCANLWYRVLNLAKRIRKLEKVRIQNPTYRNKTDYNLRRYQMS